MAGRTVLLPAAANLRPHHQGDSSSLCGLYAIINGVQIGLYPHVKLTRRQLKALFVAGVDALNRAERLTEVLASGMSEHVWLLVCRAIIRRANDLTRLPLRPSYFLRRLPRANSRNALHLLRQQLRDGRPVVLLLWGAYDHCTVAVGYTPARLMLFDSHGLRWVRVDSLGLHHTRARKRHQIAKQSAMSLRVGT